MLPLPPRLAAVGVVGQRDGKVSAGTVSETEGMMQGLRAMTEQHNADPVWRVAGPHNDVIVEREGVRVGTICECDKLE